MSAGPFSETWGRRAVTIPLYLSLWLVVTALFPPLAVGLAAADILSGTWGSLPRLRALLFFLLYLNCEVAGLGLALAAWLFSGIWLGAGSDRFTAWNYALQRIWSQTLFRGAFSIFSMPLVVEGEACITPGPILMLMRHASTADTILPAALVANRHGLMLRYLMKKELRWDACLDVVGHRLKNAYLDRTGRNSAADLEAVRQIGLDLGPEEGVVIFPEGTRFSAGRLQRRLAELERSLPPGLWERASGFTNVLPPRTGGVLALLDAAPGTDVVFCAHSGLDGARSFTAFWGGGLVGATVRVRFWRISAADIPIAPEERIAWLYDQWLEMQRIVSELASGKQRG